MEIMYKLNCQSIHPLSQTGNTSGKAYLTHRHVSATRVSRCLRAPAKPISSLRLRQDSLDRWGVFCECLRDTTAFCPGCCILDITGFTESPSLKTMRTYNVLLQTFPFCQDIAFLIYSAWELRANVRWARSATVPWLRYPNFLPANSCSWVPLCFLHSPHAWVYEALNLST